MYALTAPASKPESGRRRTVQQPGSTGGDAKTGCGIIAFIVIVLAILAQSYEFLFLTILVIMIGAFLNNESNSSKENVQNDGANQGYAQINGQCAAYEQSIYTRRNMQAFHPNPAKHVFVPDEGLAGLLQEAKINESMRYLNVDNIDELVAKFPMCLYQWDLDAYHNKEAHILKIKRKQVADKYRYMPADFDPKLLVPVAAVAMAAPAAMYYDDNDDDYSLNNRQEPVSASKPAWQDPYAYHGTEKYDEFYNLREDEYREEYGDDFEDAIDNEYEEEYINK